MQKLIVFIVCVALPLAAQSMSIIGPNDPVNLGSEFQFKATLTNVSGPAVWSVTTGAGSINPSTGVYTAPTAVPDSLAVAVQLAATGVSATWKFTLSQAPVLINTWSPKTLPPGAFTLNLTGLNFTAKTVIALGSIPVVTKYVSSTSMTVSGTIPAGPGGQTQLSAINPGLGGNTYITFIDVGSSTTAAPVPPPPSVVVSPATVSLAPGKGQNFTATVTGVNGGVTWTASAGTITSAGIFTASTTPGSVKITATAALNPAISGTATVTVTGPPPAITSLSPASLPFGPFNLTVNGSNFTAQSVVNLSGSPLQTTFVNAQQLTCIGVTVLAQQGGTAKITVSNGTSESAAAAIAVGVQNPQVSAVAAIRFLEQASFGPRPADVMKVQRLGFQEWINRQVAAPVTPLYQASGGGYVYDIGARFLANAAGGPNQLRQRVAFALSQFFVVSGQKLPQRWKLIPFEEMLYAEAFSTYPSLLAKVTLHAAMGEYLDMAGNRKADPIAGSVPNENYAREILQLFSIGAYKLNPDGSNVVVNGRPVAAYDQAVIQSFARAFTGWTYSQANGDPSYADPMISQDGYHDMSAKTLLNGVSLPAGQTAQQDLVGALAAIVAHPNVAPFFAKFLIQHLVTSNPSPGYIANVAKIFNDNGHGVKGDLQAVVVAVLLDPEARAGDGGLTTEAANYGHMQEPALYFANIVRALDGQITDKTYMGWDLSNLGQPIYNAPTVFNYYTPQYHAGPNLAPEFQLQTPYAALYKLNYMHVMFGQETDARVANDPGVMIDLSPWIGLADRPAMLVDALDSALTHGQMPVQMKQDILAAVTATTGGNLQRLQVGIYLIVTSSFYQVMH